MHYIVNVFIEPGENVESRLSDALAPFEEGLEEDPDPFENEHARERAWSYGSGQWDWWVIGGRWSGYFDGADVVTAEKLRSGNAKGKFPTPYAFVTLPQNERYPNVSRSWFPKEIYVPSGFWNNRTSFNGEKYWALDHFMDAPYFEEHFKSYLESVPGDTLVYAVDVHS